MLGMEQMYQMALDPRIFPDSRLLAVLQGKDNSLPMAVAMSAKQQRDKLEAASKAQQAQMGAKQPTVRDQMLAKDLPREMPQGGIDQLPAPNMESMGEPAMGAAGGLVSFATGGFTDPDDEDEDTEQDELDALIARQGDLGGLGAGIMSVANPQATPYSSFTGISPESGPTGKFRDMAAEAAKKHGASWDLVQHVMHKETGGMKDPANAVSKAGAVGVMQLMPKTAKELGVKDSTNPAENIDAGVRYIAQLESKYKDPKLAAMAYNWGPGNVDKWLKHGSKENAVPKETRMYVAGLAQGGIVAFKNKGTVTDNDIANTEDMEDLEYGNAMRPQADDAATELGLPSLNAPSLFKRNKIINPLKPGVNPLQSALGIPQLGAQLPPPAAAPAQPPAAAPAAAPSQAPSSHDQAKADQGDTGPTRDQLTSSFPSSDRSQSMLDQYLAGLEQSRKQAPGLAMMAAGLGIAGQRSPYALSNIGAGGLQGLQSYEQAQKQDQAGQAAALSAQAALEKNKTLQDYYSTLKPAALTQQQNTAFSKQLGQFNKTIDDEIKNSSKYKYNDAAATAYRQQRLRELISQDPNMAKWYTNSGMSLEAPGLQYDKPDGNVLGVVKPK
jgi:soluble lytic murein transglycosylase-like protein